MPLFNYECEACSRAFQLFVQASTVAACPGCGSGAIKKQLSSFAVGAPARQRPAVAPCGQCAHPDGPGACGRIR